MGTLLIGSNGTVGIIVMGPMGALGSMKTLAIGVNHVMGFNGIIGCNGIGLFVSE